jgi:hypothetical protein
MVDVAGVTADVEKSTGLAPEGKAQGTAATKLSS